MLDDEDDRPRRSAVKPPDLATWSVEELEAYIARLQAEIERARSALQAKTSMRSAADALFRKR